MENRLFLMDKNVFSTEYLNWVCDLTALVPPPPLPSPETTGGMGHADPASHSASAAAGGVHSGVGAANGALDKHHLRRLEHGHDDLDEVELSAAKVALFLALDTVARARDKDRLPQLMTYIRDWFRASPSVCRWALDQASYLCLFGCHVVVVVESPVVAVVVVDVVEGGCCCCN